MTKFNRLNYILLSIIVGLIILLYYNAVDNSLSKDDRTYIPLYLKNIKPLKQNAGYLDELNYIQAVQSSVLNRVSGFKEIPHGKREVKELYQMKMGLCFDRSRVIEKILRYSGFRTRHISMYSTSETKSAVKSLMTPGIASHAITEVLTKKGWLVVDSNVPWVSINIDRQPISMSKIKNNAKMGTSITWYSEPLEIYLHPFVYIYGLYSRHGKFYPPYNFIPDIHYGELIQNVYSIDN